LKIELIVPGKLSKHLQPAFDYYVEKLNRFAKISVHFVELGGDLNTEDEKTILKKEAEHIKKRLKDRKFILLDLWGKELTSIEYARFLENTINKLSEIVFVIGGPLGIDDSLRENALAKISLSKMTFTHEMCVILFLEQTFRAFKILKNEKYHY